MAAPAEVVDGPIEEMKRMIENFQASRVSAANLNWELMGKERERQALRKRIASDLQEMESMNKTQANDQSRVEPRYVKASEEIENKTREWECALAYAEGQRLLVQVLLLEAQDRTHRDSQAIELKRMKQVVERRIRQLDGG